MNTSIGKTGLDEFDWYEMFEAWRAAPNSPRVENVFRILELLKAPGSFKTYSAELNSRLQAFKWQSRVRPWRQDKIEVLRLPVGLSRAERWEYGAVRWLLDLLKRGELDLVHKCPMWGKRNGCLGWFYGRKYGDPARRVCSGECKQFRYDTDPEVVAARKANRQKAREDYNERQKNEDKKAKADVAFRGAARHRAKKGA